MHEIHRTLVSGMRVDAIPTTDHVIMMIAQALRNRSSFLMTFANPGTAVAVRRQQAADLFNRFDVVAPDGQGMVKAIHWLHRLPAVRASFDSTSLAPHVLRLAVELGDRIVLCGGHIGVAKRAGEQLREAYPGLNIVGAFYGYGTPAALIAAITRLAPTIVICGMGTIVQETFLLALHDSGWTGVALTCGGYLDQLAHGLQYYPPIIDRLNLRFAYRLAREPKRLWHRYLVDYPIFAQRIGRDVVRHWLASHHPSEAQ